MIKDSEITTLTIDGKEKTAIRIGFKEESLPRHIFQGEKADSIICKDEKIEHVRYESIHNEGIKRYVTFDKMELYSLEHLFTSHRKNALKIVRNIAIALESTKADFLNLETGVFPLYRIFILGEDGAFLLSPDIGDVLSLLRTPDERISEVNALIRRDAEDNYRLIAEMGELLYYAATGDLPYISDDVRKYKYEEFPLSKALDILGDSLDGKTEGFINLILHAKRQEMRDIMGNRSPAAALSWFIKRSESLEWDLEEKTEEDKTLITESQEFKDFSAKAFSGAKRNTFFRKKGTIIVVSLIVAALAGSFLYEYISNLLEPPISAGLDQEEVIMSFYESQNDLRVEDMMSAVKGADVLQEAEVTNMYVTSRMRMAYEQINPVVDINDYKNAEDPVLLQGAVIYGVTDINLERVDDDTIIAHSKWYTPYSEKGGTVNDGTDTAPATYTTVFVNEVDQVFDFQWNERGWWNITGAEITKFDEVDSFTVEYVTTDHTPL